MIKIFLSHSWAQRAFVDELATLIGRDTCVVDRFEFESGREIIQEIDRSIESSNIFVMLISDEALESKWCKHELSHFRDTIVDEDKVLFIPFIIDGTNPDDARIKKWVRKYLEGHYSNPLMLSRVIMRRYNEMLWDHDTQTAQTSKIFLGRDQDISRITSEINKSIGTDRRAIIVTGLPHIGRKRLLKEVYVTRINKNLHPGYEPLDVSLGENDSIEDFISQLNDFVRLYDKKYLMERMKDAAFCKDLAVHLINEVEKYHERIRIEDNYCIVMGNGTVADWFMDIINHPDLVKQIMMFIASRCSLSPGEKRKCKRLQAHAVVVISKEYLREIFVAYSKARGVKCKDSEVDEVIEKIKGFPRQVYSAVDVIAEDGFEAAIDDMDNIVSMFDGDLKPLYEVIAKDEERLHVLQIMCKFDFISFDFLSLIYKKADLRGILELFRFYSIFETFGINNRYLRINPAFADYIDRLRLKFPKKYEKVLSSLSTQMIENSDSEMLDLSQDLFKLKKQLRDPRFKASLDYILPSVALKVIIDMYRDGDYANVIILARKVLYDYNRNNYDTITQTIRYWLCLSYCREAGNGEDNEKYKDDFFAELKYFNGYKYHFILGFYFRNIGEFHKGQNKFEEALNIKKGKDNDYLKAKHELVICLMRQSMYGQALKLAQQCYESNRSNRYFIQAYFRCYVRSAHPLRSRLNNLMEEAKALYDGPNDVILQTMKIEYTYFIDKNIRESIENLKHLFALNQGKESNRRLGYARDTAREICNRQNLPFTIFPNL